MHKCCFSSPNYQTRYGTNVEKASISQLSGKWTLCDCVNPAGFFFPWAKDLDPSWDVMLRCFCSFQRAVNLTEVYHDLIKVAAQIGEKSDFGCQAQKVAEKNSQGRSKKSFSFLSFFLFFLTVSFIKYIHFLPSQRGTLQNPTLWRRP